MTLLIISFIAGVLTILAPCILPLLPVIVGRSISDSTLSKRRVLVVILSLGISVILFTLILKVSSLFITVPQNVWTWISGGIIFIFGLVMLFPSLWENLPFNSKINQESNKVLMKGYQKNNIWGDVIVGASLGPIFSACSPTYFVILATVLPVRPLVGMVYLLTYTIGLCLALFVVSILGQKIVTKLNLASDSRGVFKRILGVLFILVGIAIITGYDQKLQISILNAGFFDETKVEQTLLNNNTPQNSQSNVQNNQATSTASTSDTQNGTFLTIAQKNAKFILAPDISTPDGFINTDGKPITISQFKGKSVVLLDFWTYSCINCQRTIPYLNDWYAKYKDEGLVIIGVSTPEFSFEKVLQNVQNAVTSLGIKYPVVLDNDFSTWNAYQNQYWPHEYLIDIDGYIVHDHAGEGDYEETEQAIQDALKERNARLGVNVSMPTAITTPTDAVAIDPNKINSPETYFGSARNEYLANGVAGVAGTQNLTFPTVTNSNSLYLDGTWSITDEYAENSGDGSIIFKYDAKNVYMVASSSAGANVEVYLDGKLNNTIFIKRQTLYQLIKGTDYGVHTLMLKIEKPGIDAFTFTFG